MPLADYQTLVDDLVRDRDQVVSTAQRDAAIDAAVAQYSADRPRAVVVDVTSTGGQRIDLPAGYTEDSRLLAVEFPIGVIPPMELPLSDVSIYATPNGRQLDLPLITDAGDELRITYTGAQLLDASDDTVPQRHRQAVASLAASYLCGQLASYYSGESDPTIAADTVDYKDKSQRFRLRGKDLALAYTSVVGAAPSERTKAASATVELTRRDALGYPRLFHPVRNWQRS